MSDSSIQTIIQSAVILIVGGGLFKLTTKFGRYAKSGGDETYVFFGGLGIFVFWIIWAVLLAVALHLVSFT